MKKLHYKKARYPCNMPVKTNKRNVANKRGKLSTVHIQIDNITRKVCVPHAITSQAEVAMQRNVVIATVATTQEAYAASVTTHSTIAKQKIDKGPCETITLRFISKYQLQKELSHTVKDLRKSKLSRGCSNCRSNQIRENASASLTSSFCIDSPVPFIKLIYLNALIQLKLPVLQLQCI